MHSGAPHLTVTVCESNTNLPCSLDQVRVAQGPGCIAGQAGVHQSLYNNLFLQGVVVDLWACGEGIWVKVFSSWLNSSRCAHCLLLLAGMAHCRIDNRRIEGNPNS
jgi:hypothetical protein